MPDFGSLVSIGGTVLIEHLSCLSNISGFGSLEQVNGDLVINDNADLQLVTGLGGLTTAASNVEFLDNAKLGRMLGMTQLTTIAGALRLVNNSILQDVSGLSSLVEVKGDVEIIPDDLPAGLESLVKECAPWEVPDQFHFHCNQSDDRLRTFLVWVASLLAVTSVALSFCEKPWDIDNISQEGGKLVVKTRGRHFLWRRNGASFPVAFHNTGSSLLENESNLHARVCGHSLLEVDVGPLMGGVLEEIGGKDFSGTISVGRLQEFTRIWFLIPLFAWMVLGLLIFVTLGLILRLTVVDLLKICTLTLAAAAVLSLPGRLWMALQRRKEAKARRMKMEKAQILARLENAGWEANARERQEVNKALVDFFGWSEADLEVHWQETLKKQSQEAGVSVAYLLSDEFLELAQTSSGLEDPTFYDLKEAFFYSESPIGQDVECPRDGRKGCALVDVLPRCHRRACTHFLSWTWKYSLSTVRSALKEWLDREGQNPADVFLYMCFFVNNQYRILLEDDPSASDNLEDVFEGNLSRVGKMVALLDTWDDPFYLTRIWTVFEQYTAVKIGIPVEIIMSREATSSLINEIYKGAEGILRVKHSLGHVDSRTATAWNPKDEQKVKALIEATTGFEKVDWKVRHFMVTWVARQVQDLLIQLVKEDQASEVSAYSRAVDYRRCSTDSQMDRGRNSNLQRRSTAVL